MCPCCPLPFASAGCGSRAGTGVAAPQRMRALVREHAVLRIGSRSLQNHNEGRRGGRVGIAADVEDDAGVTEGDIVAEGGRGAAPTRTATERAGGTAGSLVRESGGAD